MEKRHRRRIVAGTVVGLAVAGGGAAIAATQLTSPQATSQAIVDDAAQQLGITPTKLSDALKKALENQVDAAVKDGRLTKDQGDALKAKIESNDYPLLAGPGLFGFRGLRGGPGAFGHFGHVIGLSTAADYLGLTEAELRTQLESGKTLADVAKAQNKSVDGLVQTLYDEAKKDLDAAVTAGKLTSSQEQTILSGLKQQITDSVNGTGPKVGPGFGGRGPGGFGFFRHVMGLSTAAAYLGLTEAELRTQLESGKTLADVAKAQNKSVDGLVQALYDEAKKDLDAAVTAGKLTSSQEQTILSGLKQQITDSVNGTGPKVGPGFGGRGSGGFGFFRHVMGLSTAAGYLGLTEAELRTQLESGKSLADVAKAQNKSVDGLVQALYDEAKKDLDAAVTAGKLTSSQEQTILSGLKQQITDFVNGTRPQLGFRAFGPDRVAPGGNFPGFREQGMPRFRAPRI